MPGAQDATVGQRPMLGALPDGPGERAPTQAAVPQARREDGGLGLQRPPAGPKRGMLGLAETLRGRRPRIGPQRPLTLSLEALAGLFRGHGVSWARRRLAHGVGPCNPDTMPPKDRTRVQPCVWGVGYACAATGLNGLTMGRGGKMAHDAPAPRPGRRRVVTAATWKSGAARSMREQCCRKKGDE